MDRDEMNSIELQNNKAMFNLAASGEIPQTCCLHQGNKLDYVCVDSTEDCVFKCMFCVTDEEIKQHSLIPIKQVALASEKTIFANFPFSDRSFTKQIKAIVSKPPSGEILKADIEKFFKDLRANILSKIDTVQENMLKKAQNITDINGVVTQLYNTFSEKQKFKGIMIDSEKSVSDKSAEIKTLCAEVMSKEAENKQAIEDAINKVELLEKAIDFETPKLIKDDLLRKLETIDMFLIEDMADFSESLQGQNINLNTNQSLLDLMKLVRNKFNDISEEKSLNFEEQLNRIKSVLSLIRVPATGTSFASLNALTSTQTEVIKGLVNEIARMNSEVDNSQEEKEEAKSEELFKLVSSQANFCSNEYLEDVQKVMDKLKGVFSLFSIKKLNARTQEQTAINRLMKPQLLNIARLANKVNQLTEEKADDYLNCNSPLMKIQTNSTIVKSRFLNNLVPLNGSEEYLNFEGSISQLLVEFPIFELLPEFQLFNQLISSFIQTKYKQSSEMIIKKNLNGVSVKLNANKIGQVVSEILNNDHGYLLKLKFNKPIGKHTSTNLFLIGLIRNTEIDRQLVYLKNTTSGFLSAQGYGSDIIKKGGRLSNLDLGNATSSLEFRWCISKKQFFVSDSTYQNINQTQESEFDPAESYRFGVCFYNLIDNDWEVTITEFAQINPEDVSKYE